MNATQAINYTSTSLCPTAVVFHFNMTPAYFVSTLASCAVITAGTISGTVGNVLVLWAFKRNTVLHNNANYVLALLAFSDLLTAGLTQPAFIAVHVEVLLNKASCVTATIFTALRGLTTMASLFSTLVVSLERTVAIMAPFWYTTWVTPFRLIVLPVCASLIFSMFDASRFVGGPIRLIAVARSLLFVVCLLTTLVCYGLLHKVAKKHRKQISAQRARVSAEDAQARKKSIHDNKSLLMAIYVISAEFLSYVPLVIGILTIALNDLELEERFIINSWMGTAVFLNTSLNPVIYCWQNTKIRRAIVGVIKPTQLAGNTREVSRSTMLVATRGTVASQQVSSSLSVHM